MIVQANAVRRPTGVQARMFEEDAGRKCDQQIGMRDADLVRALDLGNDLVAILVERGGVDFAGDEEMRDGSPALRGALGHQAAERGGDFEIGRFR